MKALEDTRVWLEKAVIALNLCPFAKAVHSKGQIRWVLCEASDAADVLAVLKSEMLHLQQADANLVDTTLLVCPKALPNFYDFNDFLGQAEDVLADLGLEGVLQIASFHPHYQFANAAADDIDNLTNRSPHPTLHLLREDSVERAVAAFADAADIYQRNIETLRRLGRAGWAKLFS